MADEREAKLAAPSGVRVPALDGVLEGVTAGVERRRRLLALHYDTDDLALARAGLTLRYRTGEDGDRWTVKLAGITSGSELRRPELTFAGRPGVVPPAAQDLVRVHTRGRPLRPVARLRTVRSARRLRGADGTPLAEVADDRVTAYVGFRQIARFRELEVELLETDDDHVLDAVVDRLVEAGATSGTPMSKLVRALGAAAQTPPDVVVGKVGKRTDAREFVRHVIAGSTAKILAQDPLLRLGSEVADIHVYRVATRRLRSDLHTFRPLLERDWVRSVRDELKWIADVVGAVRDADVLATRLRDHASALAEHDAGTTEPLLAGLGRQRDAALATLHDALRSPRYDALIQSLVDASSQPKFAGPADIDVAARVVVSDLVRRSWRRLRREVRAAGRVPTDEALHRIRIVAKRARYAAEAAALVHGKPAARFAEAMADVQNVLGEHHDAHVAEGWLRRAATDDPGSGLAAGLLIARQQRERERLEKEWKQVWRRASKKQLRAWL